MGTHHARRGIALIGSVDTAKVARVFVDTGLPHLDRTFDYLVPDELDEVAQPGVRVKVRFAGKVREGWLVERSDSSEHRLSPLHSVVSPTRVLLPEVARLAQSVAERFGGMTTDVLRSAIPPRQARIEKEATNPSVEPSPRPGLLPTGYVGLHEFLERIDQSPRASWLLLPARPALVDLAEVVRSVAVSGSVLVLVPDAFDVHRLHSLLDDFDDRVAVLTGELAPAHRYRNFLSVLRGQASIVIGTRSAVFAPAPRFDLIVVFDDGSDAFVEPHAPGWNVRTVAALRSHQQHSALLYAGYSVSVETQGLVEQGWLGAIDPEPSSLNELQPHIRAEIDRQSGARVPTAAWQVIKAGLAQGPVLVSVAFTGYQPTVTCAKCRTPAECECGGRLASISSSLTRCRLCGRDDSTWSCVHCGHHHLRATSVGAHRTLEELGKAFPGVPVIASTSEHRQKLVDESPRIVVSTTGVEPDAHGGYRTAIILDADIQLSRSDLRVEEEARRRWFNALSLVAPNGECVIVGEGAQPSIQSLIAWSPRRYASRELAERQRLRLGPIWQVATVESEDVAWWRAALEELGFECLGPVASSLGQRLIVRAERSHEPGLATALKELASRRSAEKMPAARVRVDPYSIE